MRRDSSYTLCKGFIRKLFNKNNNIEKIKIEILDISDNSIKTKININEEYKTFDIILNKKKKKTDFQSLSNLKNQKKDKNNDKNSAYKESQKDIIMDSGDVQNEIKNYVNNDSTVNISNFDNEDNLYYKNNTINEKKIIENNIEYSILNIENKNNICFENKEDKHSLDNNYNYINTKENNIFKDNESEPDDEFDYTDPYFLKNPDDFSCFNCYTTNVEKGKLFDHAQELIYKYNDLENENKNIKKDILDKDKIIYIYKKENNELKDIISKEEDKYLDFITKLNSNFMTLFLITHKSFTSIRNILITLEKSKPKKIPDIINKNISKYMKQVQDIADEAEIIRNNHLEISNNTFGNKLKQYNN